MLRNKDNRLAKRMRWAARAIGTAAAVLFVAMLIVSVVSEGMGPMTIESSTLVLLGAVALAGCIASWWRDMTAGILLVLTSIGLGSAHRVFCWSQSCPGLVDNRLALSGRWRTGSQLLAAFKAEPMIPSLISSCSCACITLS